MASEKLRNIVLVWQTETTSNTMFSSLFIIIALGSRSLREYPRLVLKDTVDGVFDCSFSCLHRYVTDMIALDP